MRPSTPGPSCWRRASCARRRREQNLQRVGIGYDRILCRDGESDKDPRFATVQAGGPGHQPLEVLMWVGDNIEDFPGLSQERPDLREFGTRFFVLPRASYGSWEALPRR